MSSSTVTLPRQALSIGIEGMTCSSCAARVEKLLGRLPCISRATVSFSTESALLESDSVVDLTTVRQAIEKAGFHVPEENRVLAITGMTCSSCAARVEKVLAGVPGVVSAVVNLATEQAHVTLTRGVPTSALIEAVFAWPGIGRLLYESISKRDYPVMLAILLMVSALSKMRIAQ